jgi:hypothetical protein
MGDQIRHNYDIGEQSYSLANSEVGHAQQASDDTVTSGKVTLAGLGENNSGATDLINKNHLEYQRAEEYRTLSELDARTDGQSNEIQRGVGSSVQKLFGNH